MGVFVCLEKSSCLHARSLQSCLALWDPLDCSPPSSSIHGILQAKILEWVAMASSRGSSQPRGQTYFSGSSCIGGGFFTIEPWGKPRKRLQILRIGLIKIHNPWHMVIICSLLLFIYLFYVFVYSSYKYIFTYSYYNNSHLLMGSPLCPVHTATPSPKQETII